MEETLPITITASKNLLTRYHKLASLINKQEAQINFHTLAAGWYEDENNITTIHIILMPCEEYQEQLNNKHMGDRAEIADDVSIYRKSNAVTCFVAITEYEIAMLDKTPKILSGYITIKVKKIMNEVAVKLGLLVLP